MFNAREVVKSGYDLFKKWLASITNPEQFLAERFHPTEEQLIDGLEFYLAMLSLSLLLYSPFVLTQKGDLEDKGRAALNSLLGLIFSGVIALAWYFAFVLLGGTADFTGTYLAYVYAGGPYLPLTAFASLIVFAGLPPELRRLALNPATAQQALQKAKDDRATNHGVIGIGSLALLGLLVWSAVVQLRCYSHVHDMDGWRLVWAVLLSLVIAAPVNGVLKAVGSVVRPGAESDAAPRDRKGRPYLSALALGISMTAVIAGVCALVFGLGRAETVVVRTAGVLEGEWQPAEIYLFGALLASLGGGLFTFILIVRRR